MEAGLQEQIAFYLTGKRPHETLQAVEGLGLRPALLAGYRDLTQLRHDYPLVLVDSGPIDRSRVQSLSAITDRLIRESESDDGAHRIAQQLLRVEQTMRAAIASGAAGSFSSLWQQAIGKLGDQAEDSANEGLERAIAALNVDGDVIGCSAETPWQVVRHLWASVQTAKIDRARREIDALVLKLTDILRVDSARSAAGLSADALKSMVGSPHAEIFDFNAMSRLLSKSTSDDRLPEGRRLRIEQLIETLKAQRFFGPRSGQHSTADAPQPYSFEFSSCTDAYAAFRERASDAVNLARAIQIAELELSSQYDEARHDTIFEEFGAAGLDASDAERFPDYLVFVDDRQLHGDEHDVLNKILSEGLPIKILVQTNDVLDNEDSSADAHLSFGSRSRQLTSMAIGLNDVFVLQSTSSHLYQFRDRILAGLENPGAALFSVFSGESNATRSIPTYLVAAAAMESRVFPAFVYDPSRGETWADRFQLDSNPQSALDWPTQQFAYEDTDRQRAEVRIAFTPADFIACDSRFAKHLARTPHSAWHASMVPVADYLNGSNTGVSDQVPSLMMIDEENMLHRAIVDDRVVDATRRCLRAWHSLQELGGIHNSHAERLLERERRSWEDSLEQMASTLQPTAEPVLANPSEVAVVDPVAAEAPPVEEEQGPSPDEAYVETARCTTCNECIQINNKMFAYDENQQCHIADLSAGTYRDLVEAAENCQVAIIHPGKPRDLNEPGLDDLIERAALFQ